MYLDVIIHFNTLSATHRVLVIVWSLALVPSLTLRGRVGCDWLSKSLTATTHSRSLPLDRHYRQGWP